MQVALALNHLNQSVKFIIIIFGKLVFFDNPIIEVSGRFIRFTREPFDGKLRESFVVGDLVDPSTPGADEPFVVQFSNPEIIACEAAFFAPLRCGANSRERLVNVRLGNKEARLSNGECDIRIVTIHYVSQFS